MIRKIKNVTIEYGIKQFLMAIGSSHWVGCVTPGEPLGTGHATFFTKSCDTFRRILFIRFDTIYTNNCVILFKSRTAGVFGDASRFQGTGAILDRHT